MKKALIAGAIILFISLLAALLKIRPTDCLITMIAYWVFLDRLEREDKK